MITRLKAMQMPACWNFPNWANHIMPMPTLTVAALARIAAPTLSTVVAIA
jgi:hypothetical protein